MFPYKLVINHPAYDYTSAFVFYFDLIDNADNTAWKVAANLLCAFNDDAYSASLYEFNQDGELLIWQAQVERVNFLPTLVMGSNHYHE